MSKVKLAGVKRRNQQIEDTNQIDSSNSEDQMVCARQNTQDIKRMPILRLLQQTSKRVRTEESSNQSIRMAQNNSCQIIDESDINRNPCSVTQHTSDRELWVVTTRTTSSRILGQD